MKKQATVSYKFKDNQELDITLGYKTLGKLNKNKDNVILVIHSFSSNSNFAQEDNKGNTGYWDNLIGENKTIDTNKYFVISFDNLSNVQFYNDYVITTGPRSLNKNNERYNLNFPIFTFKDVANIQYKILKEELGINHLEMIIGASAGGCITWHWSVEYPDYASRIVPIITNPKTNSWTKLILLNTSIKALENDPKWNNGNYDENDQPKEGLALGISAMNCIDFKRSTYEKVYQSNNGSILKNHDEVDDVVKQMYDEMQGALQLIDPLHYYYMSKAMMQYDVSEGYNNLKEALQRINAKLLLISCKDDLIFPSAYNNEAVEILKQLNKDVEVLEYEHENGHMSTIFNSQVYEDKLKEFLNHK